MTKKLTKKERVKSLFLFFADVAKPLTEEILEEAHELKFYKTLKDVNPANLDVLARYEALKVYSASKTPVKVKVKKGSWREVINEEDKKSFQHIVHTLCRYYDLMPPVNHPSDAHKFRMDIVNSLPENFKVYLKPFGEVEYLIVCEIHYPEKNANILDSWIHVDGIVQEREFQKEKGNLTHPTFNIVCITDFIPRTVPVTKVSAKLAEKIAEDK